MKHTSHETSISTIGIPSLGLFSKPGFRGWQNFQVTRGKLFTVRQNRCSTSDFACSFTFLCRMVCLSVCLSVCHLSHCFRWGFLTSQRKGKLGGAAKTCTCLLMIHQEAAPISDFVSYFGHLLAYLIT